MKTPKLKEYKKVFAQKEQRDYEFKETECGRFFVWKNKYANNDPEVSWGECGVNRDDYESEEEWDDAYYKDLNNRKNIAEENKKLGFCVELTKYTLQHFIDSEQHEIDFFKECEEKGSRGNFNGRTEYIGTLEENAKKRYESKKNNCPYGWYSIIGRWHRCHMIPEMYEKSEYGRDENGEIIYYNREFFDSIDYNDAKTKRWLKKLKTLLEEHGDPELMYIYDEFEDCKDHLPIKEKIAKLKLEFYFIEKAKEMESEVKKLVRGSGLRNKDINYSVTYNTSYHKVEFSAYSHTY